MDPLSDALAFFSPRGARSARLQTGGNWSIWYPPIDEIKFAAVTEGTCYITLDGDAPMLLKAGDCYLLTDGRSHRLSSHPDLHPVDARVVYADAVDGFAHYGPSTEFMAYAGKFDFDTSSTKGLFSALPSLIRVTGTSRPAATIGWMLQDLVAEIGVPTLGSDLMVDRMAHIMLVQALRMHIASTEEHAAGWLSALADEKLAVAIGLIHTQPGHKWSIRELAAAAGMSRSLFAQRFKQRVGMAPVDYLIQWRIRVAARELAHGRKHISEISYSLGYDSVSAFSSTFKRITGMAPKYYRESSLSRADAGVHADVKPAPL